MSRPKSDPVEDVFRRVVALDDAQQLRLKDMLAGYRASGKFYSAIASTRETPASRKRTVRSQPLVEAAEAATKQ